jgi:hypothetical protein
VWAKFYFTLPAQDVDDKYGSKDRLIVQDYGLRSRLIFDPHLHGNRWVVVDAEIAKNGEMMVLAVEDPAGGSGRSGMTVDGIVLDLSLGTHTGNSDLRHVREHPVLGRSRSSSLRHQSPLPIAGWGSRPIFGSRRVLQTSCESARKSPGACRSVLVRNSSWLGPQFVSYAFWSASQIFKLDLRRSARRGATLRHLNISSCGQSEQPGSGPCPPVSLVVATFLHHLPRSRPPSIDNCP